MTSLRLPGENTSALGLLAPVGLAAVLDEACLGPATFAWDANAIPSRATVMSRAESEREVAEAVRRHAERHTRPDSWLQATILRLSNAGKGLFSPRAGIQPNDWAEYLEQRGEFLSGSVLTDLDWAMLAGLGEPCWWHASDKDGQPDKGASRWEMKTRNRGEEIVVHRLRPLAAAIAHRSTEGVLEGLMGSVTRDECGGNRADSRTATGLAMPGPVDSVQAWLALWGLCALPVARVSTQDGALQGFSQSPGMWPRRRVHPEWAVLPIVSRPQTWRGYRALMVTKALDDAAFAPEQAVLEPRAWLREQGVVALGRFPILRTGSSSAPERQIQSGIVDVL